jgi:hypothetical protein
MMAYATFALGFAAGWSARGTTQSSRSAVLTIIAAALSAVDRIKRVVAIEKDHLEDLVAEARARADVIGKGRPSRNGKPGTSDHYDEAAA